MKPLVTLILCAIITSFGQILLKKGLLQLGDVDFKAEFLRICFNPYIFVGILCCLGGWGLYMLALSKTELSYAYPIWSLSYVIVPVISLMLFGEHISLLKTGGLVFLTLGILFIAMS